MKVSLEYRISAKVESHWPIMEWLSEHACTTIDRCLVGKDGRVPYQRRMGKTSKKPILEIGEQILAKPLRSKETTKRLALRQRWALATWVGIDKKTNEHIAALDDGGLAIKVRTVMRRPASVRWSADKISKIRARPRSPNPEAADKEEVLPERLSRGLDMEGDGTTLLEMPETEIMIQRRDFKITKNILERCGYSDDCQGCEGHLLGKMVAHSKACRSRLEDAMAKDELSRVLSRRDVRLGRTKPREPQPETDDREHNKKPSCSGDTPNAPTKP